MRKTKFPFILNGIFFVVTLFLSLATDYPQKWKEFNDPADYLQQSKIPLNSREFYAPHQQGTFFPRPFTVPLLYKLAGSDPVKIIRMQKVVHSLATLFMAYAMLLIISGTWIRYLVVLGVYVLMSWWNILGWASQLLSESLSVSLLVCWIASFILTWKKKNPFFLLLHILITILFSFTRDTWPYIILLCYFLVTVFILFSRRALLPKAFFLLICSVVLFFVQLNTARVGHRHRLPLMNTMAVRILPDPVYTAWFEVRGMPDVQLLHTVYRKVDVTLDSDRHKIWNMYWNPAYKAFSDWTINKGRKEYMKFMVSHPSYFFLFHENKKQLNRILAYNLWYTPDLRGYSRLTEPLLPFFGVISVSLICFLLIIFYFKKREPVLLFPVLLWLLFFANVLISYNADALEVERHLFVTMIAVQLIGIISVALILDQIKGRKEFLMR